MICSSATNVVDSFGQDKECKGVPVAFPNVNGWGDLSTRPAALVEMTSLVEWKGLY